MSEQKASLLEMIGFTFVIVASLSFIGVSAWHLNYHNTFHNEEELVVAETIEDCDILRWTNPETRRIHYFLRCDDK